MTPALSPNTQAILLLTAPLIVGRNPAHADLMSPGEYKRFAHCLREVGREPADLLNSDPADILDTCKSVADPERIRRLLGRGFQLTQAVERWQARAIWVVSRADTEYPRRLKARLRGDAPAVLYGCGEINLLDNGGLAVVGSRDVSDDLVEYTMSIGYLAARAGRPVVSGGAKGIDQAAMRGALEAGGQVSGVLADSLEKQALNREHRNMLLDGQLTLVSPYDPNAGFNVGNAMQRNKLIYALADAALVVSSDVNKGGTWTGAVEQLDKLKLVPVFVRSTGGGSPGLDALRKKGAVAWPNPHDEAALEEVLNAQVAPSSQGDLELADKNSSASQTVPASPQVNSLVPNEPSTSGAAGKVPQEEVSSKIDPSAVENPAEQLLIEARKLIECLARDPIQDSQLAEALMITPSQAKTWLNKFVEEGILEKKRNPVRYVTRERSLL